MKSEIEMIFYDINVTAIKNSLKIIHAVIEKEEFLQRRVVYDFGRGVSIDNSDQSYFHFLRLRAGAGKTTLTYKKIIEGEFPLESETVVGDFDSMRSILKSSGLQETSYQENKREVYLYKNTEITIDTWPHLEPVCEIESQIEGELNEVVNLLNLDISKSFKTNINDVYKLKYGKYIEDLGTGLELKFDSKNPFL